MKHLRDQFLKLMKEKAGEKLEKMNTKLVEKVENKEEPKKPTRRGRKKKILDDDDD